MICKDEEKNIERALTSVRPWINTWVIVDTGSTDGTKDIIRRTFADVSGFLEERPWVNFGYNRTEALHLCKGRMDWAIMIDADDNMAGEVPPASVWGMKDIDGFAMKIRHGPTVHQRIQIFRVESDWRYTGVVHEYAELSGGKAPHTKMMSANSWMNTRCEGVRSRDPHKYLKDALLLESEHLKNPTNFRTIFYTAQSYRDAGRPLDALIWYSKYLDLSGGWDQEKYMCMINIINLSSNRKQIMELAWAGLNLFPERLEVQAAALTRHIQNDWPITQELYGLLAVTKNRKLKESWLFVNPPLYVNLYDDILANVAHHTGHYQECYDAAVRIMLSPAIRDDQRLKALKLAQSAADKIRSH